MAELLLTLADVSRLLNVSLSTVKRITRNGTRGCGGIRLGPLPTIKVGASIRVRESDLHAWIQAREVPAKTV